ncbi:sugar 3,4-ketoisomerase [Flavobacterium ichthyis]|uniref:sugar 3,4-ketoisomerase n=1 Tax=Flavobacterium ichthyis TaxID=2698827 RepID=UPI00293BB056|nr:FdtA/QdtA family cupin domain-containing protein [Flavobacterium ichthyis]
MISQKAHIIQLPQIPDERGNLSFFEFPNQIPFEIKRTYWIYDIPGGENNGHAFRNQTELIVALSGSFEILTHDGKVEEKFTLNRANKGVLVPKMHWRQIHNISTNAVVLVVSDAAFDENDYIRDFDDFLKQI